MAKFIEVDEDVNLNEEEELTTFPDEEQEDWSEPTENVQETEEPDNPETEDIPDKYKGKSAAEIIRMHQEAEKLLGKHSSEVGELRKIVDDFIHTNLNKEKQESPDESEQVDFWEDPDKAFETKLKNHPSIKQAEELSKQLTQQQVVNKLNTEYPDWEETVQSEDFAKWIQSSNARIKKYANAANNYDWDDADDLLGTWQELKKARTSAQNTADADVKQQRKKASTGSDNASNSAPSRKVYKRQDIVNLMRNDPKRYAQLANEIERAYAEGRVR